MPASWCSRASIRSHRRRAKARCRPLARQLDASTPGGRLDAATRDERACAGTGADVAAQAAVIDIEPEEPTQMKARAAEATQLVARADEPTQIIVETPAPAARSEIAPPPSLRPETRRRQLSLGEARLQKPAAICRRGSARAPGVAESPFGSCADPGGKQRHRHQPRLASAASGRAPGPAGMRCLPCWPSPSSGGGGAYMGGLFDLPGGGEAAQQPAVTEPPVTDATHPTRSPTCLRSTRPLWTHRPLPTRRRLR